MRLGFISFTLVVSSPAGCRLPGPGTPACSDSRRPECPPAVIRWQAVTLRTGWTYCGVIPPRPFPSPRFIGATHCLSSADMSTGRRTSSVRAGTGPSMMRRASPRTSSVTANSAAISAKVVRSGARNRTRFLVGVDSLAHVVRCRGGTGTTRISGCATGVALAGQAPPEMETVADLDGCGATVGDACRPASDPVATGDLNSPDVRAAIG